VFVPAPSAAGSMLQGNRFRHTNRSAGRQNLLTYCVSELSQLHRCVCFSKRNLYVHFPVTFTMKPKKP